MTQLTDELASIAATLRRSTVQVRSGNDGVGAGVIWHSDGIIITNAHVVRGFSTTVELWDGRVLEAAITAKDPVRDLAAIKVNEKELTAATIGNSDNLRVGELVLAVGNPLGVVGAFTTGIIHAVGMAVGAGFTNNHTTGTDNLTKPAPQGEQRKNPNLKSKIQNLKFPDWIQADIRLYPGNSGGPLADARGRVIGINSMVANGLALAIPSNAVEGFLQKQNAPRPYLGVTTQPVLVRLGKQRILGLLVLAVTKNSAAFAAGIAPFDVLIKAGDDYFRTPNDLVRVLWEMNPGDVLPLELIRQGQHYCLDVMVGGASEAEAA
ncbi:S1C family serine protease [Microseira wollei]|uniref:Peptidase S1 and S6, chymotrypsin/Hap n=1 Tax=Microseira wollei NIES-4236 TaxID=2530354 RepID=A0AAV3WEG3_9CYAN|nr:trypsin-like peptidase domain-containing protein [Microseira wollei]GET35589.1 peptidase S1 and S6, chymotrypsin/Hap [Microseira wollei NIES-4236]